MRSVTKLSLVAVAISAAAAMPALAQKAPAQQRVKSAASADVPPGLLVALKKAFPTVGHGDAVPPGKGKGWGHLLHDHQDTPVSP